MVASPATLALAATLSRSNLGPLTTTYTPDSACFALTLAQPLNQNIPADGSITEYLTMFGSGGPCLFGSSTTNPHMCFPQITAYDQLSGGGQFYSPGLVCPSSWSPVVTVVSGVVPTATESASASATVTDTAKVNGVITTTLLAGETAVVCCPE
jgi:hypothetical protein